MIAENSKRKTPSPSMAGEKLFAKLVVFYATTNTHVEQVKLFGFDCLRVDGKVFAKLHSGDLVIKLPVERIDALMDSGHIASYECRGRLMKQWAVVTTIHEDIIALAEESRGFVEAER